MPKTIRYSQSSPNTPHTSPYDVDAFLARLFVNSAEYERTESRFSAVKADHSGVKHGTPALPRFNYDAVKFDVAEPILCHIIAFFAADTLL